MSKPRVTVVLPVRNASADLETTLMTLTRQFEDPRGLKLVAIDDGSTDGSGEILEAHADQFGAALLMRNEQPVGAATARNQGTAHVDTDLFCYLDADDWMAPGRLEALAASMRELACDFVRTDHITVTPTTRQLVRAPHPSRGAAMSPRSAILPLGETTLVDYPHPWAGMLHRRLIDAGTVRFCDGLFTVEERPWIWRLHLEADSFAVVDAPPLLYRRGVSTPPSAELLDAHHLDFVRAFDEARRVVMADADAERFLPKLIGTILAVCDHHLNRSLALPWDARRDVRRGVAELLAPLPNDPLRSTLAAATERRRRRLAPYVRAAA